MAKKKAAGSVKNGRDSAGRRLGLKCSHGSFVNSGSIILRQRGTKFNCGLNVSIGRDHTIYSLKTGYVYYNCNLVSVL